MSMDAPALLRSLRHRNYRLFFTGQLISLIGTWMDTVAEAWLVYRLSHSPLLLGVAAFASQIPVFLLAPIGGLIADRYDRRKILIWTQALSMVQAMALAILTLTHVVTIWHVILLAAGLGIVNAIDMPTRQAFVVDMVSREDLMNAIALNSSMFNGARVIGPAVAGLVVAAIGEGWCFFANSVSYLAVIAGLWMMTTARSVNPSSPQVASVWSQIKEGFGFVMHEKPVRALLSLLAVVSLFGMSYSVLMPVFADQILHAGPRGLGLLMGSAGIGALCGAISLALKREVKGLGRWIMLGASGFGVALIVFGQSRMTWLSCLVLLGAGYAMMVQMSSSNTLIQSMVPNRLRGRVMALYTATFMGMAPVGALVSGTLAQHIGAPYTVAIGGGACIVAGALFGMVLPSLRPHARRLIVAQQAEAAAPTQP
ncbi:MAG: MFS transporter [Candidatus Koribacter versatilis]|uniref:MFS transporter n=1 Tax=Candidatus Korobacter versatilis TaxID=658062 RepID=A0A932A741_9BACT|nr:MFS transporter [Candidatus Koribacter versatilis]